MWTAWHPKQGGMVWGRVGESLLVWQGSRPISKRLKNVSSWIRAALTAKGKRNPPQEPSDFDKAAQGSPFSLPQPKRRLRNTNKTEPSWVPWPVCPGSVRSVGISRDKCVRRRVCEVWGRLLQDQISLYTSWAFLEENFMIMGSEWGPWWE